MNRKLILAILLFFINQLLFAWGNVGHTLINRNTTKYFHPSMSSFKQWAEFLAQHASDADYRKSSDPDEGIKHYIDIDNYPWFMNGNMITNYDSLVAIYGLSFVLDQGTLPWTIKITVDTLTNCFLRKDWNKAMLIAADLGHYVGDLHQPLHLTRNYDGQYSNQKGVHSRYETQLLNRYQDQITFDNGFSEYVNDVLSYTFVLLYQNYRYLDTVLNGDTYAKNLAGSTGTNAYYEHYWTFTSNATNFLIRNGAKVLSSLIYTAWKNGGEPQLPSAMNDDKDLLPDKLLLYQNYPNPFNYSTQIKYYIPANLGNKNVKVVLYDTLGNLISVLTDKIHKEGLYQLELDAKFLKLSSGVYLYEIQAGDIKESRKLNYLK